MGMAEQMTMTTKTMAKNAMPTTTTTTTAAMAMTMITVITAMMMTMMMVVYLQIVFLHCNEICNIAPSYRADSAVWKGYI